MSAPLGVRALVKALVVPALRRRPDEIARRAEGFRIETERGRRLVERLGRAFIQGFNAMLEAASSMDVRERAEGQDPHFKPFFLEGAAMGYLPRGSYDPRCRPAHAERDLLAVDPGFSYLYHVGLGFWYGFRHARRPERLEALAGHLDPLLFPLCYDGFGFKLGFFDREAVSRLDRCPSRHRASIYQGFGRALFFVHMDDAEGFRRTCDALPAEHRWDLEFGRALACAFTGVDRPRDLADHIATGGGDELRSARLTGVTWALAARQMSDPAYFALCLRAGPPDVASLLGALPEVCNEARRQAVSYADWQDRTREAAMALA